MTIAEYNNTVRDLLKDNSAPADIGKLGGDQLTESTFSTGGAISDADAFALLDISDALSTAAVQHLSQLLPGNPPPTAATDPAAWAQTFIATFGKRAYRRPLLPEESDALFALYQAQGAPPISADFSGSMRAVVAAMLMSPSFLYRWELGPQKPIVDGNVIHFNQYERASRLSYWLWASMPDDALLDAADKGELATPDQIDGQVRRMLLDPKVDDGIVDFHTQWLELSPLPQLGKDARLYPTYTPDLIASMLGETRRFTIGVLGPDGDGRLETLLTSSSSFVDELLAKLYGVKNFTGQGFAPVMLDPAQRAGIFTQAAFLTTRANLDEQNPIFRGASIIRRLLCETIKKPDNVEIPMVMPDANTTIRARYEAHGTMACAKSCHAQIDPPGMAFLNYDAIGAYTDMDTGQRADASGSLALPGGTTVSFHNAVDMMKQLATRPEVSACMSSMWLRYLNRRLDGAGDEGSLAAARTALGASSNNLREMIVALAKTNAFADRLPNPGEQIQ
jgi:hypothetical protein